MRAKKRKVACITGSRSDYGLMGPVFRAIAAEPSLELSLIVTGMNLLPEFHSTLEEIRRDCYGRIVLASMTLGEDSARAMAQSLGLGLFSISAALEGIRPDVLLLQGDRGEMLAGAIAAAHMNIPIVHMSGGDFSGSIDDSIRNAISKFAHIHLTTCSMSTDRLLAMGEDRSRIREVGEPALDFIRTADFIPAAELAKEFRLDLKKPILLATQHSVTSEVKEAPNQILETLSALDSLGFQTVFTYPNSDAGGRSMIDVLERFRDRPFLRIVETLGAKRYLSFMRMASVIVGNSSSGILEAPSFKVPVVNIGTRQYGRLRANNVIDVGYDRKRIARAIQFALQDQSFRKNLRKCRNPYGDGKTSRKTVQTLTRLKVSDGLMNKWMQAGHVRFF